MLQIRKATENHCQPTATQPHETVHCSRLRLAASEVVASRCCVMHSGTLRPPAPTCGINSIKPSVYHSVLVIFTSVAGITWSGISSDPYTKSYAMFKWVTQITCFLLRNILKFATHHCLYGFSSTGNGSNSTVSCLSCHNKGLRWSCWWRFSHQPKIKAKTQPRWILTCQQEFHLHLENQKTDQDKGCWVVGHRGRE